MKNQDFRKHVQPDRVEPRGLPRDEQIIESVLDYIKKYKEEWNGNSPSLADISQDCLISSISLVNYYLFILESQGRIKILKNKRGNNLARSICIPGSSWSEK